MTGLHSGNDAWVRLTLVGFTVHLAGVNTQLLD